ncbi:MAG: hypothetical protein IKS61_00075 [Aeriscardovia sp.]|nr:hypothetical protein [Aeriscardovia sp.]
MAQSLLAAKVLPFRPAPSPYPPLDYLIPPNLAPLAKPGSRAFVRVKEKGMEGLILQTFPLKESRFKDLKPIDSVSPAPGMDEEGIREAMAVSEFFGGHLANTLDLALPDRVQYVEKEALPSPKWGAQNEEALTRLLEGARRAYGQIPDLEEAFSEFENRSFVWDLAQGRGRIFDDLALIALLSKRSGYSFLACLPSANLFGKLGETFRGCGLSPLFAGSSEGRAESYRAFLACSAGGGQVIGTRKAMHFPVKGPCVLVDANAFGAGATDGIAPYANIRDALSIKHEARGGIRISMAYCHGAAQEKWLQDDRATRVFPASPPRLRPACFTRSRILDMGDRFVHLPSFLVERLRKNGAEGKKSLLVCPAGSQILFFLCPGCGAFMKCPCGAALKSRGGPPSCLSCKKKGGEWECGRCGGKFPSRSLVPLQRGPERVRGELENLLKGKALENAEVAVAGALPQKPYSLVAILDAWLSFFSLHLDSEAGVLNSWMEASSLASEQVILIGEGQKELLSSFSNWNCDFSKWDLNERKKAGMPPYKIAVNVWGKNGEAEKAVEEIVKILGISRGEAEVLGPMPSSRPGEELCVLLAPGSVSKGVGRAIEKISGPRGKRGLHFWIDPYCFGCR